MARDRLAEAGRLRAGPKTKSRLLKGDERAGEGEKSEVVLGLSLPAHEETAISVVPAVGAFDDPAPGLAADASDQRLLAAAADVRDDSALTRFGLGLTVVVALVEAEVVRTTDAAPGAKRHGIERLGHHPLVVDVRRCDLHSDGHAARIGQDVTLDAFLSAIGRVGTRMVPPFGAFTIALSRLHQRQSMPRHAS